MAKTISTERKDKRKRLLKTGESLRKDGRYAYKYVGTDGKPHFVYSWRLSETDPLPKGKRPCKPLRELEKEIKRDLADGINSTGAKMTVCELYAKHNELKSNVRESTQKNRKQLMKLLQDDKMGNMQIEKVKPSDAKQWVIRMKEQGFAFQTINNHKRSLKAIFYTAIEDDLIRKNPFNFNTEDVIENDTEEKIVLTDTQADLLLRFLKNDCTYQKHYHAVTVLLNTGLRISELCGLTVNDIDFENGFINVNHQLIFDSGEYRTEKPKTDSGIRRIPMNESVTKALKAEISNKENVQPVIIDGYTDFVFLNKKGFPMYGAAYSVDFGNMVKKYNKHHKKKLPKISPHILRHTFCTNMAIKNMPPKALQYIMGHKDITTTLGYYAHGSAESAKIAMESLTA
jgi:integrase